MSITTGQVNYYANWASKTFNVVNSIPFIGSLTSPLRAQAAWVFGVASGAAWGIGVLAQNADTERKEMWERVTRDAGNYAIHGFMECARAYTEVYLNSIKYCAGSLLLILGQTQLLPKRFEPIFDYNTNMVDLISSYLHKNPDSPTPTT